ncbi:kinase-like protein [Rhizophagus irregularis]|uniref:Kinase-like protein n=1 Tax=Rhizophagus irregularis TaxID=588596 RepID=A0A2I1HBW7_9GLOM|nr:kinase-like protein [Rhizophagus irregularis]
MTNLKEWINMKVNDEIIKYFEYNKFSDIEDIAKGGFHQEVFRWVSPLFDVDFHVDFKRKKIPDVGIVRSANWIDAGIKVALKSPLINSEIDENQMENFVKELKFLHQVNVHPNINRFLGVTKDQVHDDYIIILQYANQGNLREYLERNFLSLHWKDKSQMALDITCGLKYLHSSQIIHRDLHAKNILVNNGSLMIADFGLSKHLTEIKSNSILLGMPAYIDPQCYIKNNYKRNEKSDIYSLGVLLWEISSGTLPFSKISVLEIIRGIREVPIEDTPVKYKELYEICWSGEPNQRPDIDEVYMVLIQLNSQLTNNEQIKVVTKQYFGDMNINNSEVADSKLVNLSLPNNANVLKEANWIESSKLQFNSKIQFNTISSMKNPYSNTSNLNNKNYNNTIYLISTENWNTQINFDMCYLNGTGTYKNQMKAFEWYLKSAENGNSYGQFNLGCCYEYGIGTDKNETKAFEWYLKSAKNGNGKGQLSLGNCYKKGIGIDKNEIKAFEWYLKSAENGNSEGQLALGSSYFFGIGTDRIETKAFEWYLKSAENGNSNGQFNLGNCYKNGIGTDKNETKAFEWYLKSAENGNSDGQLILGNCYKNGIGTDKNEIKAFEWYLKSAENENDKGQFNLGTCYENGIGTDKNEIKAFEWYLKSAKNGNRTDKNEIQAFEWYLKSEKDLYFQMFMLAYDYVNERTCYRTIYLWSCYFFSTGTYKIKQKHLNGTDKNETKAFEWK